jgi:hypothetical protein
VLLGCLALTLGIAACGSSGSSSSSNGSAASTSGSASATDNAAAAAAIKSYVGQPSAFPVTDPLKSIKKGATVAFMDCGTPISHTAGRIFAGLDPDHDLARLRATMRTVAPGSEKRLTVS